MTITEAVLESLRDSAIELMAAMADFDQALQQAGARDSEDSAVKHFAAYHQADLEGEDGGWLGREHLKDALTELIQQAGNEAEDDEDDDRSGWCDEHNRVACPLHDDDDIE